MNKKTVSLILALFCFLLIIVVSVLGKIPENPSKVHVESIEIVDYRNEDGKCKVNAEGTKLIELERGTLTYQIEYVLNPAEPTEKDVYFSVSDETIATIDDNGLITFYKEESITVRINSNFLDDKKDSVVIEFTGAIREEITDNPFGKGGN